MTTPLLLLDVDGVLNALGRPQGWPDWQVGSATAGGARWPIRWAPDAVARLRTWHEQGRVELQWLTTWGHDANGELRALLGLPELTVAGTYADLDAGTADHSGTHASVAPSAPDALTGRWWKHDVVRRIQREQPERLLVWVDDELHDHSAFRAWADAQPHVVPIGPDPAVGLSPDDLAAVERALS